MNAKKDHVLFISPAGYGGIQSWCISMGEKMYQQGFDVTIIWEQNRAKLTKNPNVPHEIKEIDFLGGRFVNQSWAVREMTKLIRTANIVYPNTSSIGYRAISTIKKNCPIIIAGCHSIDDHDYNTISQFEPICDSIFTLSNKMTSTLKRRIPKKSHYKLKVIRHGVDLIEDFSQLPFTDKIKLLVVGRLDENKQPQIALEILYNLIITGLDVTLTYIGGGYLRGQLNKFIATKDLEDRVIFEGGLEKEEVAKHYKKSHFTLLLSKKEGFGLVALEAMNNGSIPIVANNTGVSEIIVNGENGFVVDINNLQDEVSEIIINTSKSHERLKTIAGNSKKTIIDGSSSLHSLKCHLDLIEFAKMNPTKRSKINMKFKKGLLDCALIPNILTYNIRRLLS